jgi:two-component system, cell cycle sensor histidine kinase and response regulator CckA
LSSAGINTDLMEKKSGSYHWRPVYAIYMSIIIAFVVTLIMISSHLQYSRIMKAVEPSRATEFAAEFGYGVLILMGFVDLLIVLGGVLIYTVQKRRKYSEELTLLLGELKRSSAENEAGQEKFRLITENITDVILTTDMQGRITYITPSVESYMDVKQADMIGKKIELFVSRRSLRTLSKDMIERRQNPERFKDVTTNEIELAGKDGQSLWVELKTIGFSEKGQQTGYLGVFRDITKRRKNERYLKWQGDVLYNISDEINIVDLDGRILYVNKAVLTDLNMTKDELLGRTKSVLLPDPEYNVTKTDIIKWVKEKGHWEGIVGNYLTDGRRRIVSTRSKLLFNDANFPVGIVSISTNITNKIEMEKELRQSESKYRLLIANVSDVIWTSDREFKINFVTRSVERMLGYTSDEFMILKQGEYLSPDTIEKIEKLRSRLEHKFSNISFPVVFNSELICKDRSRKWAEAKINPMIEEDGTIAGFVGVWRDITSFIQTSDRNKALEERLSQSEKMEALGRLAGGVAHDLNNVLTGIVAYPDLLLMKLPEEDPMRKKVIAIKKSGQKAAAIVEDLLSLSRRGVNKFIPLNLNILIKDLLDSPEVEKLKVYHPEIRFKLSEGKNVPPVSAAEYQISKSLINLFTNACEAMPSGGSIFISTKFESSSDGSIRYKNIPDGDYAVVTITDEGVGISKEDQKKIYEPFFTSKVMGRSGTGLGMAVVWGTIQDHNGYIEMKSKLGEGTTFDIYLPALSESAAFESEIGGGSASVTGKGEKILILDDEIIQLEIAESLFTELNYKVRTVSEPDRVLDEIDDFKPDIVILDMILTEKTDGLDVYKKIKEKHKNMSVMIISGYSESERVIEAISLGVKRFVKKPFTIEEIGRAIRDILENR